MVFQKNENINIQFNQDLFEETNQIQLIRNKIIRVSQGSVKKRDMFSMLLLIQISIVMIGVAKLLVNSLAPLAISYIFPVFLSIFATICSVIDYLFGNVPTITFFEPVYSDLNYSWDKIINPFGVIPLIALIIVWKYLQKESFFNEIIKSIIVIIVYLFLYGEYKFSISAILFIILFTLMTMGNGQIYDFVRTLILFLNPFLSEFKDSKRSNISGGKIIIWTLGIMVLSKLLSVVFNLPIEISISLVLVVLARFGLQIKSDNKRQTIILKSIIYVAVFAVVLITNKVSEDLLSLATVIVAIFFAFDRFFSLYKEVKKIVKKDSIEYYLYFNNSIDELKSGFITDELLEKLIGKIPISESIIQLIIRLKLGMIDSFLSMSQLLAEVEDSDKYDVLLLALEYQAQEGNGRKLSRIEFIEERVSDAITFNSQAILPIDFLIQLGEEYYKNKDYNIANSYLYFSKYFYSIDYIKLYIKSLEATNQKDEANSLRVTYQI